MLRGLRLSTNSSQVLLSPHNAVSLVASQEPSKSCSTPQAPQLLYLESQLAMRIVIIVESAAADFALC